MKFILSYFLIGVICELILVRGNGCNADKCVNENVLYYDNIAQYMFPHHSTYVDHKKGHDVTFYKMNSIKPESVVTHVSDHVQIIPKAELNKFREPFKAILKSDLNFEILPAKITNIIDLQTDLAAFMKKRQEYYIRIDLSADYGGTSDLTYGVFAFLADPTDAQNIIFGATAIREEWTEKENVKILLDQFDKGEVGKYLVHEMYQQIHPKVSEDIQAHITHGDDPFKVQPFSDCSCRNDMTHVMFISDKSGSMSSNDNEHSVAEYEFIKDKGYLNNRLGALFSAIHDFIQIRSGCNCNDIITSILFDGSADKVDTNIKISNTFVRDYLVQHKPTGGTNFGKAFQKANELISYREQTIVIFLTDGEASDNGASDLVKKWFTNMSDKLKLLCVVIGNGNRAVVNKICENGEVKEALNGEDLSGIYKRAAKYKIYQN